MADITVNNSKLVERFRLFEDLTRKMDNVNTKKCTTPDIVDYVIAIEELNHAIDHMNTAMERLIIKDALLKLTDM